MKKLIVRFVVAVLCLTTVTDTAKAQSQIPVSGKEAAGIFGALIGVVVGIGVGVYFLVRAPHNITGCVLEDGGGLQMTDAKTTKRYLLEGDTALVKAGERVSVYGKPDRLADKQKTFLVKRVVRDYGSCNAAGAIR